ncbi:hypothetical protein FPHYL_11116 [Fusarium phyllophilum]|uniref:Uncharacterized protein n=1 Tax=Fusarium phyllophilum TaxID=47803 RepID=A0A8H5IVQ0_9HYPO|nr:hypothetical protein FPHYL_11116 [Fusarium phyllophilum]
MTDHSDAGPTRSPYASGICAVYFSEEGPLYVPCSLLSEEMKEAADFQDDDSAHPLAELWLDDITLDVGHVIIHYLVTGTYQYLQQQEEEENYEKGISAEFAIAIRVYVATNDSLPLPALREMARREILHVGDWISLPALIKVMEEAAMSFKAYPGIATYVESRLLSFSATPANFGTKDHVDETLAALGAPDTLSQVVLRSVLLPKASTVRQQEAPTYRPSWEYPGLELRPTKQAMERAETISLRNAEAACDEIEIRGIQQRKAKRYGQHSLDDQQRLRVLEQKAEKRAKEIASERELDAQRWDACKWPAQQYLAEEVVDPYEPAPVFSRASSEVPKPKAFERHDQCDSLTDRYQTWTDQLTPGSSQSSPEDEEALD